MKADNHQHRQWVLTVLDQYECRLVRYASRLLGDEDAARDVVQHVFLKLCEQSPDRLGDRIAAWLYTVCRNRVLDIVRGNGKAESLESAVGQSWSDQLAGNEPDPAGEAEKHDLCRCLTELVDQLLPSQREVVDLWMESFSYSEIAEITERTEGNVRVIAHRAFKSLREHPRTQQLLGDQHETTHETRRIRIAR